MPSLRRPFFSCPGIRIGTRVVHEDVNLVESAAGLRVAIVVSRYHETVTAALRSAAEQTFLDAGGAAEALLVVDAPGTFELPVLCGELARRTDAPPHAIVALGCVITGQTMHDQYINAAVSQALAHLSATTGVPIAFGVLTCATIEQAAERAGGAHGNKGAEAMRAAIVTARTIERLRGAGERCAP